MNSSDLPDSASRSAPERLSRASSHEAVFRDSASRPPKILGLVGSLRRDSSNRRLLAAAGRALGSSANLVVFEHLKEIPAFDEDDESAAPAPVVWLRDHIEQADAVLIATPEYNGSLPGQLKNALDWASRPFATNVLRGKPVAVIGASPSPGGTRQANADTRRILVRIGAAPIEAALMIPRALVQLDGAGTPTDGESREQLAQLARALVAATANASLDQTSRAQAPANRQGVAA